MSAVNIHVISPQEQVERDLIRVCRNHIKQDSDTLRALRRSLSTPHAELPNAPALQSDQDSASKQARARLYLYTVLRGLPLSRIGGPDATLTCSTTADCGKVHWNASYYLNRAWKQTTAAFATDIVIPKPRGADFLD